MIVAVPTNGKKGLDEQVGEHFGRVPTYTLVDTEKGGARVIVNTSEHMGGVGMPPELLAKEGANVLVCQGLGRRAIQMFDERGIEVYVGASGTVQMAIEAWRAGKLAKASESSGCEQHAFHDQHRHENCEH